MNEILAGMRRVLALTVVAWIALALQMAVAQTGGIAANCASVDCGTRRGTPPKDKPQEYDVNGLAFNGHATVAAAFYGHTYKGQTGAYNAPDFVVIEVAVYPAPKWTIDVQNWAFQLRINGKQQILPASAEFAAAKQRHPEWQSSSGRGVQLDGNLGGIIGIGGTPQAPRYPEDPTGSRRRRPTDSADNTPDYSESAADALSVTALPEGPVTAPTSGFLYFPFEGKLKSIKSLELVVTPAKSEPTTLKLK